MLLAFCHGFHVMRMKDNDSIHLRAFTNFITIITIITDIFLIFTPPQQFYCGCMYLLFQGVGALLRRCSCRPRRGGGRSTYWPERQSRAADGAEERRPGKVPLGRGPSPEQRGGGPAAPRPRTVVVQEGRRCGRRGCGQRPAQGPSSCRCCQPAHPLCGPTPLRASPLPRPAP